MENVFNLCGYLTNAEFTRVAATAEEIENEPKTKVEPLTPPTTAQEEVTGEDEIKVL